LIFPARQRDGLASSRKALPWCAFADASDATLLKEKLARRYRTAKVLQFTSPVGGDWLRIRVADDDKQRAQEVMRDTHTDAGVYLVRLD
jgi:rare lipoprotein A